MLYMFSPRTAVQLTHFVLLLLLAVQDVVPEAGVPAQRALPTHQTSLAGAVLRQEDLHCCCVSLASHSPRVPQLCLAVTR